MQSRKEEKHMRERIELFKPTVQARFEPYISSSDTRNPTGHIFPGKVVIWDTKAGAYSLLTENIDLPQEYVAKTAEELNTVIFVMSFEKMPGASYKNVKTGLYAGQAQQSMYRLKVIDGISKQCENVTIVGTPPAQVRMKGPGSTVFLDGVVEADSNIVRWIIGHVRVSRN